MTPSRAGLAATATLAWLLAGCATSTAQPFATSPPPVPVTSPSSTPADVVVAPFAVLQFDLPLSRDSITATVLVTVKDSNLTLLGLSCHYRQPCKEVREIAPGTLRIADSDSSPRYDLDVVTKEWGRIKATGVRVESLVKIVNCPNPDGTTTRVNALDGDRLKWTGSVGRVKYRSMACNFYVRAGIGERRSAMLG